jgi:hypothetical protein
LVALPHQLRAASPGAAVSNVYRNHLQALEIEEVQGNENGAGVERWVVNWHGGTVTIVDEAQIIGGSRAARPRFPEGHTLYVIEKLCRTWALTSPHLVEVQVDCGDADNARVVGVPEELLDLVECIQRRLLHILMEDLHDPPHDPVGVFFLFTVLCR